MDMRANDAPASGIEFPPAPADDVLTAAAPADGLGAAPVPPALSARPAPAARPVQPQERVAGVDVLRGVALMGILAMNIVDFGWPSAAYDNPRAGGNTSATDQAVWAFNHVVFDEKMMTLFSMLFGAGLVLMTGRSDARGASLLGVYYRRVFWLLVIGLAHAYLVWHGDILVLYAECGFLLYPFRRRSPRALIALGALCLLLPVVLGVWISVLMEMSRQNYWGVTGMPRAVLSAVGDVLNKLADPHRYTASRAFDRAIVTYQHGYWGIVQHRAFELLMTQTVAFAVVLVWMVGGRMLVGMALMKLEVFSGRRSARFYAWMVALGYGLGLPVVLIDTRLRIACNFQGYEMVRASLCYGYLSAVAIALGHVGVVMLVFRGGALPWLTRRLAAAGRMALSNYLMQSLICTTLFYGYGCCLYGRIDRLGLWGVVVSIWIFQLATSIIWLHYFRYGPAEWVWRSLTYLKPQPMLVGVPTAAPSVSPEPREAEPLVANAVVYDPGCATGGSEPGSTADGP
jgi:uncharacterized protein